MSFFFKKNLQKKPSFVVLDPFKRAFGNVSQPVSLKILIFFVNFFFMFLIFSMR
jgi:RecA-family ATPase